MRGGQKLCHCLRLIVSHRCRFILTLAWLWIMATGGGDTDAAGKKLLHTYKRWSNIILSFITILKCWLQDKMLFVQKSAVGRFSSALRPRVCFISVLFTCCPPSLSQVSGNKVCCLISEGKVGKVRRHLSLPKNTKTSEKRSANVSVDPCPVEITLLRGDNLKMCVSQSVDRKSEAEKLWHKK